MIEEPSGPEQTTWLSQILSNKVFGGIGSILYSVVGEAAVQHAYEGLLYQFTHFTRAGEVLSAIGCQIGSAMSGIQHLMDGTLQVGGFVMPFPVISGADPCTGS